MTIDDLTEEQCPQSHEAISRRLTYIAGLANRMRNAWPIDDALVQAVIRAEHALIDVSGGKLATQRPWLAYDWAASR